MFGNFLKQLSLCSYLIMDVYIIILSTNNTTTKTDKCQFNRMNKCFINNEKVLYFIYSLVTVELHPRKIAPTTFKCFYDVYLG